VYWTARSQSVTSRMYPEVPAFQCLGQVARHGTSETARTGMDYGTRDSGSTGLADQVRPGTTYSMYKVLYLIAPRPRWRSIAVCTGDTHPHEPRPTRNADRAPGFQGRHGSHRPHFNAVRPVARPAAGADMKKMDGT